MDWSRKLLHFTVIMTLILQPQSVSGKESHYGGTLCWGICHKPTCINPVLTTHSVSMALVALVFNGLVRVNAKGEIEPDLARSWEISEDGLTYTFFLRQGIRFHDGKSFTAEDAVFTYQNILSCDPESPYFGFFDLVREVSAPDAFVFRIRLKSRSSSFIYLMTRQILPRHLFSEKDIYTSKYNFQPVGTGPFCFEQWTKDNQIMLRANHDYFEGRPYLDRIKIKTFASDREVWSALMREEIDFCGFLKKEDYEILKEDKSFKTYEIPSGGYYALLYDLDCLLLSDIRVRQALAQGINLEQVIERTVQGKGRKCYGPFPPDSPGYDRTIKKIVYAPDKAKQSLKDAGWEDKDCDGILEKEGKQFELRVLIDERSDLYQRLALVLRQELQGLGIKLRLIPFQDETLLNESFFRKHQPNCRLSWISSGNNPDQSAAFWTEHGRQRGGRIWAYDNKQVQDLCVQAETAADKEKQAEFYKKVHRIIYQEQPACFLFFSCAFCAVSAKLKNSEDFFSVNMPVHTIKNWYWSEQE